MAEKVRSKKPKHRERSPIRVAPRIPERPVVIDGVRLPEVPRHAPMMNRDEEVVEQRISVEREEEERSKSPEPEELVISENEEELVEEPKAPPIPPRTQNSIFPRSTSMVADTRPQDKITSTYPTVPEMSELPSYTAALNHPTIYPSIATRTKLEHSQSATAMPTKTRISAPIIIDSIKEHAPPVYPLLKGNFERNEHGLMTEMSLMAHYHNAMYENANEYVDRFIKTEEVPIDHGYLFSLLKRFKQVYEQIQISQLKEKETTENLQKTLRECWKQETMIIPATGKCGEDKNGTGQGKYSSFIVQEPMVQQMGKLLTTDRLNLLDYRLCEDTIAKSLALQIQWQIIEINNCFMSENQLNLQSPPKLIETGPLTIGRTQLRRALSDLFYHLRYPRLPQKYTEAIIGWIRELICVLNMNQSCDDGLFILCHILRLPSPIDNWAPAFVQTFIQSQSSPKLKVDYCIAFLTHLLNPIKARETFLKHVAQSEKEESAWEILSDNDGDIDEFSFVTINETDLIALLDQIPISELYAMSNIAFTNYQDKTSEFTALVAFQLLLMKILDNGLTHYAKPGYKLFCRQIGITLKHSVQEICNSWRNAQNQVDRNEERNLQREVDRIVLLALNYLIHRDSVGLFQFVVDLPYDVVSEECRNRCEYALRSKDKMTIHEIYETPICEVQARIKIYSIQKRIKSVEAQDAEFLVNCLASIGSYSKSDVNQLISQLVDVCFCDETTRNELYKCGGEAIGQILEKRPESLHQLLAVVDRNLEHMDSYAINVLSSSRLFECRLTDSMASIIGKWLINHPPEHGGNRLARRVLAGLHWGPSSDGQTLWIDADVHQIAAETIVKAHSVHCSRSNGMISKSIKQITKLASKVGDAESHFQQFCWDMMVKLKLSRGESQSIQNDLTAYYVTIVQKYEESLELYLEKATPLLSELVSSGSSVACVVLISRLIAQHYERVQSLANDKNFMSTFERLLHVDQLSYAVQWMTGPSATPTPIVKLICSAISYYATRVTNNRDFLRAWIQLLCVSRSGWNEDQVTYQIVGTISRIAFLHDQTEMFGLTAMLQNVYTQQLATERNASKGLFSVFSADTSPSPLIPDTMLTISPFATYLMLLVEEKAFDTFNNQLFEIMSKKDKYTLEDAIKKTSAKLSMTLPIERLAVFRWAKFVGCCEESQVLPLAIQRMTIEAYKLRKGSGTHRLCFSRKLLGCQSVVSILDSARKSAESSKIETKGLAKAALGWWTTKHEVTRQGFDFSIFDLDYLLQLVLAGDEQPWIDFVNIGQMNSEEMSDQKMYATTCQLIPKMRSSPSATMMISAGSPRGRSKATGFPTLPIHHGLSKAVHVDLRLLMSQHQTLKQFQPHISTIHQLAEQFAKSGDEMQDDDEKYQQLIRRLYVPTKQMIPVTISCSSCSRPKASTMEVTSNAFSASTDAQMAENRKKRIEMWNELNTAKLLDKMAVVSATIEHFARTAAKIASSGLDEMTRRTIQLTGRSMIDVVTSSVGDVEMGFTAALEAYKWVLKELGEEFVKFRAEEQMRIMERVLDGFVLSDPLVEVFTPEVLNAGDLCAVYLKLSEAVRMPPKSKMALQLLGRLGMQQAAAGLPPHQFAALLPIAFANLASQPDPESPLHVLCLQHVVFFVFHHFPANLAAGLDLAIEGCSTISTPPALLDAFVEKLGAANFSNQKNGNFELGAAKAEECGRIMGKRLDEARRKMPNFYSIFGRYLDSITRLIQLFLYVPIRDGYQENQPLTVLQRELYEHFGQIVVVFSPLIAPYSPTHPPFTVSNENQATLVLDRFIELLKELHYNSSIPPGMQNIQALVWQFYCEKLSTLTHGTQHYYDVLERQLVRLNWQTLWPSKLAVDAMETCLETRSTDCASFVSQIVVRIPWNAIFQQMSTEDRTSYLASLFTVLVRLVSRTANHEKVRASFLELIKSLSLRSDWVALGEQDAERISKVVEKCLPSGSSKNLSEVVSLIHVIWRKICCFVPRTTFSNEIVNKQKIWLKTECILLLRCDPSETAIAYSSLISDVNALTINHENLRAFCVVSQELTAVWKVIGDVKMGESLVNLWTEYLTTNVTSPLVLTSLNTLIGTLEKGQVSTALRVMEKTIEAYFLRTNCSWAEVMHWINFPNESKEEIRNYLLTIPRSENKVTSLPLTLRTFLDYGNGSNVNENCFFDLHHYVQNIKPKHIQNEGAFVCLLARMTQWMSNRAIHQPNQISPTDDLIPPLIQWLKRSSKDESGFFTSLISSKKTSHSQKLRVIMQIFELYLTQQTLGDGKKPRCDYNSPVLNSRISTLKELAQQKSNQHMSAAFNKATAFFVQIETYHIGSASKLLLDVGKCTFGDNFLSDV